MPGSESAPVPVPRNACGDLSVGWRTLLATSSDGSRGSRAATRVDPSSLGRSSARGLGVVAAMPRLELIETMVASAGRRSAWVEVGILIKRNNVARVPVAEDVATTAAMVAAGEVAEVTLAGRIIADGGLRIRLS